MLINKVNIRATALQDFWGRSYDESLYLWYGAQDGSTARSIDENTIPTLGDPFAKSEEVANAHEFCRDYYYKALPKIAEKLREIHGNNLSDHFWQIVIGYWLYRHICVVYDKFVQLEKIDLSMTDVRLLSEDDYFFPQSHADYIFCFAGDFGVQQLVSQYYRQFSDADFSEVKLSYESPIKEQEPQFFKKAYQRLLNAFSSRSDIALVGAYFSEQVMTSMSKRSAGLIKKVFLPPLSQKISQISSELRGILASDESGSRFDRYFNKSLYYAVPADLVENFLLLKDTYDNHLSLRNFKYVVSEEWISDMPVALYTALARERGAKFIAHEHGAGTFYYKNFTHFMDLDIADSYLSIGWENVNEKHVLGGFDCRDVKKYQPGPEKKSLLFVTRTKFAYNVEFNEYNISNSVFLKEIRLVADVILHLPENLRSNLVFRPRPTELFWNVEQLLELDNLDVTIDRGDYANSILEARIIIIDHLGTGFAEVLASDVPFILVLDTQFMSLSSELGKLFLGLSDTGVLHSNSRSAIRHLEEVYDDSFVWWNNPRTKEAVYSFRHASFGPSIETENFLCSLVDKEINSVFLVRRLINQLELSFVKTVSALVEFGRRKFGK